MEFDIGNIILEEELDIGNFEFDIIKEQPELEDLTIYPSTEKQVFNHPNSYGYDNVTVEPLEAEELNIIPSNQSQQYEGIYKKVNVEGDENLLSQNIKSGVSIFGVEGTGEMAGFEINDCSYLFYNNTRSEILNDMLKLCKNVSLITSMFHNNVKITEVDLTGITTNNIVSFNNIFSGCNKMTKCVCPLDVSTATDTSYAFSGCTKLTDLDISKLKIKEAKIASAMFQNCSSLTSLDLSHLEFDNLTTMQDMFSGCSNLTYLNVSSFNTTKVTTMLQTFNKCSLLENLDISNFDGSSIINVYNFLNNCKALTNLNFMSNLGKGYTMKSSNYANYGLNLTTNTVLSHDSLIDVINKLYDLNISYKVADGGTLYVQNLVLGNTNIAKLTAEEIAIATSKGWVVS